MVGRFGTDGDPDAAAPIDGAVPTKDATKPIVEAWHLNSGSSGKFHRDLVDYRATIRAEANASLTVHSDTGDVTQANNQGVDGSKTPLVVPGMSVFHGQFLQLDVVAVTIAPPR